jgi:hypothetical protein
MRLRQELRCPGVSSCGARQKILAAGSSVAVELQMVGNREGSGEMQSALLELSRGIAQFGLFYGLM